MPSLRSALIAKSVAVFVSFPEVSSDRDDEQVITPLLIILRVANRKALTRDAIVSGNVSALHFGSEGKSTDGDFTLSDGNHAVSSIGVIEVAPEELSAGGDITIEEPL